MRLKISARLRAIKALPLVGVLEILTGETYEPNRMALCPIHSERSPSFHIREVDGRQRWHCFGCGGGGDAIDFAQRMTGSEFVDALEWLEDQLGLVQEDDDEDPLKRRAKIALAGLRVPQRKREAIDWTRAIDSVESEFSDSIRPYLLCRDPLVVDVSEGTIDYVFESIAEQRFFEPLTARGKRDAVRSLREFARGHAAGIERFVERAVGKDRFDVILQARVAKRVRKSTGKTH